MRNVCDVWENVTLTTDKWHHCIAGSILSGFNTSCSSLNLYKTVAPVGWMVLLCDGNASVSPVCAVQATCHKSDQTGNVSSRINGCLSQGSQDW